MLGEDDKVGRLEPMKDGLAVGFADGWWLIDGDIDVIFVGCALGVDTGKSLGMKVGVFEGLSDD